jgi:hypothetical protein
MGPLDGGFFIYRGGGGLQGKNERGRGAFKIEYKIKLGMKCSTK